MIFELPHGWSFQIMEDLGGQRIVLAPADTPNDVLAQASYVSEQTGQSIRVDRDIDVMTERFDFGMSAVVAAVASIGLTVCAIILHVLGVA